MLFIRFMFCLAVGLIGLSMVLMTMLETLFADWDVAAELRLLMKRPQLLRRMFRRHEESGLAAAPEALSTRLNPYGRPARLERTPELDVEAPLPVPMEEPAGEPVEAA